MLPQKKYQKYTLVLLVATALVKIGLAPLLELGNDEVYYWTYALRLSWNYFDHPPMIAWMIRATTLNTWWVSELSLRLGSILGAACSTWFIFKTGKLLANERVGWFAALLYTASIYTGFIAGFFILPDSPQMPLWTATLYITAYLILKKSDENNWGVWILLGALIGFAALCKVHGLFLWVGFGLFILIKRRTWLLKSQIYISALITMVIISPVFFWNWQNDFITYRFHSNRIEGKGIHWDSFFRELGGEFAYQNPMVFVLLLASVIVFFKGKIRFRQQRISIWIFCMSLPMLLVFWTLSLFNPTLPHWSGPAFIPLFFLAAVWLDQKGAPLFPFSIKVSLGLVVLVLFAGTMVVRYAPINFGSKLPENYGEYCPTLDLSGWSDMGKTFTALVKKDQAEGLMQPDAVLLTNQWFPGGHLEFYMSRPSGIPLIAVGSLQNLHQFAWLNKERKPLFLGADAYVIVPSNMPISVQDEYGKYFDTIEKYQQFNQVRNGGVVRYFFVYRLKHCKKLPAPVL
jgi:4-amino-4-deoxy-L-arabinose transferase-like glycosyltransferase